MTREEFNKKVTEAVIERLRSHMWFRGVCVDGLDHYFNNNDLNGAIEHATHETIYWDDPSFGIG